MRLNIDRSFPSHPLPPAPPANADLAKQVREDFRVFATKLNASIPDSREKSIMLTHLEDASMYAVKAAICDGPANTDG
ncbi:MAG TPA: hypothetical protein VEL28_13035 [Candidatus Binatia bacterium]|nr:hypothetical protein [Candidatus Binatia bacterium]